MPEAATFTVSGAGGVLRFLGMICFAVAAIVAYVAPAHRLVHVLISAGLFLWVLSTFWT